MLGKGKHITVFEHETVKLNQTLETVHFDERCLKRLQNYYGVNGVPYFSLIQNGVRFNEYVGVIQVGETVIEVLPKAGRGFNGNDERDYWRKILVDMLRAVGGFEVYSPSSSALRLKTNSILDLYFELFLDELEYLIRNGLVKQYHKRDQNVLALKGQLHFDKHIQHNLVHQERFFVRMTKYDVEHELHFIIYKTLRLLKRINTNVSLHSRIGALLLEFPEMPDLKISEGTFAKINFTFKTRHYEKAIQIARLLLLRYHPDLKRGENDVLALMFDMEKLWERFIYVSIRKHKSVGMRVSSQMSKSFWKSRGGTTSKLRPDILINKGTPACTVLDTKWKILDTKNPSAADLRQMYAYQEYFHANRSALIYPGNVLSISSGNYIDPASGNSTSRECSAISIPVQPSIQKWQRNISETIARWTHAGSGDQR